MKYKAGDRVRIKSLDWYNENKDKDGEIVCGEFVFLEGMKKFCSETLTILEDVDDGYLMLEDYPEYMWTDEMIECKMEDRDMDKLNQLKDNIKLLNTHISKCGKICNQIKKLLKFKGIKKKDVDIYFDGSDNCVIISYCLSEMNITEALSIMESNGYITEENFGFFK